MRVMPPEVTVESLSYEATLLLEINVVLQGTVNVVNFPQFAYRIQTGSKRPGERCWRNPTPAG